MNNVMEAFEKVETTAKTNKKHETRDARGLKIGRAIRQGDIYVHAVKNGYPHGPQIENRQLAVGNSKGSRHVVLDENVTIYAGTTIPDYCNELTFLGPYLEAKTEFKVIHPEHSDFILPAGCYQVTHQTNMLTRERMKD